ncbi:MAG TPA: DUF2062 domain-containing protein [Opitutaceae bacterium]|nr:DUF2062 domain-containing protein [Opitutaceae bacterium]
MKNRDSFWRRRILTPVIALLKQGITPDKLAQTLGAGFICSMFPILGTTSVLNLLIGVRLRLNHPLMQTMNQVLAPLHMVMILAYIRMGEWVWGAHEDPLTVTDIVDIFKHPSWYDFFDHFGFAVLHALTAWALTAPVFFAAIYYPSRYLFFLLAARRRNMSAAGT